MCQERDSDRRRRARGLKGNDGEGGFRTGSAATDRLLSLANHGYSRVSRGREQCVGAKEDILGLELGGFQYQETAAQRK